MTELLPVDEVEVLVLVDNVTDGLSSTPATVESEQARLARRGVHTVTGEALCHAAHGLCCLVTVRRGGHRRSLLFDAGPEGGVLARNVQLLGADLGGVEALVLSHGHWDHGGGLLRAIDLARGAGSGTPVPVHAHPDAFRERARERPDGRLQRLGAVPSPRDLERHGATPVLDDGPRLLLDGQALLSGEIPRVTSFERGLPGHRRLRDDGVWEPDELLLDERFVAVHVAGAGLVVLSACSHAGIANVLAHATATVPGVPVHTALGGFHLSGANERIIPETVEALRSFAPAALAPGHCTGWRAVAELSRVLGDDRLAPLAVGQRRTIGA